MTNTADDIVGIIIRLATLMGKGVPLGIRCSSIGSSHACSTAKASIPWAYSSSFIMAMYTIYLACTRIVRCSIGGIYRMHRSMYDVPNRISTASSSITQKRTLAILSRIFTYKRTTPIISSFCPDAYLSRGCLTVSWTDSRHSGGRESAHTRFFPVPVSNTAVTTMVVDPFSPTSQRPLYVRF